ncbi:AGAL2 [Symbiodinium sp. CCMP2456]|nr:AGAL2 [Symbiodinium sp. CCMP2456]
MMPWCMLHFLLPLLLGVFGAEDNCTPEVSLMQHREVHKGSLGTTLRTTNESLKAEHESILNDALQAHEGCSKSKNCSFISEHSPMFPTPATIPVISYADAAKTQAAWQAPMKKTYDNGVRSPALGWNSWNQFNLDVNETKVLSVARAMKSSGLLDSGFEYIIIDDGWGSPDRDQDGRLQADPAKFPNGIKWLAEQLHGLGFKFGIYTSVGEKTCGGGQPGIMGHIQIDAATFASWDVDYVKVDRCGWPGELFFAPGLDVGDLPEFARIVAGIDYPESGKYPPSFYQVSGRVEGYQNFSAALNSSGRTMYLEICDWGEDDTLSFAPQIANSFRMLWDNFPQWHRVEEIYEYYAQVLAIPASTRPGAYAFADMLEGGVDGFLYNRDTFPASNLTRREAATEHAMWSMWSSPLILGYDVAKPSKVWVTEIMRNPAILKINQDPLGIAARLAVRKQKNFCPISDCYHTDVWVKPLAEGAVAVALVNVAGAYNEHNIFYTTESISVAWETLWLSPETNVSVYSATDQKDLGIMSGSVSMDVEPHGVTVLVLTPQKTTV